MIKIDGRKISKEILEEVRTRVSALPFTPIFSDVLIGDDIVSKQYVSLKKRKAESTGMAFHDAIFPESVTTEEIVNGILELNKIKNICGIIVQLPLPEHIDTRKVLEAIDEGLDVDCLSPTSQEAFYKGEARFSFPTALAVMRILDEIGTDWSEKNVVVLGQGELVGRPVSKLLNERNIAHVCLDSKSENQAEVLKNADLIISAIGKENYLKKEMVKDGVNIIDAGTSESFGTVVGDADIASLEGIVHYITPVPGGVGPVTVAMLFKNVLKVAEAKI